MYDTHTRESRGIDLATIGAFEETPLSTLIPVETERKTVPAKKVIRECFGALSSALTVVWH